MFFTKTFNTVDRFKKNPVECQGIIEKINKIVFRVIEFITAKLLNNNISGIEYLVKYNCYKTKY